MDPFQQAQTPANPVVQSGDEAVTKLAEIKNEQGAQKYASLEVALDALKESQTFIPNLQGQLTAKDAELTQLRAQIAAQTSVADQIAQFTATQAPQQQTAQPEQSTVTPVPAFGQADVQSLVQNMFAEQAQQQAAAQNYEQVQKALASSFGDKATEHLQSKATELNTTVQALQEMARTNPVMSMQLLGLNKVPANTPAFGGNNTYSLSAPQSPAPVAAPSTSMLVGANTSDVIDFMAKIKAEVHNKHGITA